MSTTTISEHIWKFKRSEIDHTIKWEILNKALPYSASIGRCNLRIAERINILYKRPTLNKRRELFCTCPYRRKCLLQSAKLPNENLNGRRKKHTPDVGSRKASPLENG